MAGAASAEGYAILQFLVKNEFKRIYAHDLLTGDSFKKAFFLSHVSLPRSQRELEFEKLCLMPVNFRQGREYLSHLQEASLIFAGQNWFAHKANAPIAELRDAGIPVVFLIQLYFALSKAPIAAITGTNGKTTVTSLLFHILQTGKKPVLMSGNDRYHPQVLARLDTLSSTGTLVLEVSNRQLLELDRGPHIAILTNVRHDHIAEHGSFEQYCRTKQKIFALQESDGYSLVNLEDPVSSKFLNETKATAVPFTTQRVTSDGAGQLPDGSFGVQWRGKTITLFDRSDLVLPGMHNLSNAIAAAAAAFFCNEAPDHIRQGIKSFRGVKNRMEWLISMREVNFYDDLASTNPAATIAALESMNTPVVLIAGGQAKGNESDYETLAQSINRLAKAVILMGGDVEKFLKRHLDQSIVTCHADDLHEALDKALHNSEPGDSVILSPAGAGFYSLYAASGRGIRSWVRAFRQRESESGSRPDFPNE